MAQAPRDVKLKSLARPAEPLLASSLVGEGEIERLVGQIMSDQGVKRRKVEVREKRLGTGVKSLDEELWSVGVEGLEGGRVVSVCGETGSRAGDFVLTILANSLLESTTSTAAIIDTTGNLDILRLYSIIHSRLQSDNSLLVSQRLAVDDESASAEDVAAKALDRVKIMRVFDLVGVMEAVGEIRQELEGRNRRADPENESGRERIRTPPPPPPLLRKTVIADSEDEADEMLFDTEAPTTIVLEPAATSPVNSETHPRPETLPKHDAEEGHVGGRISFILIDNLAHVITPLLKKDYLQSHALISSFLLSLSHLTQAHALHTILLNPASIPRLPPPKPTEPNKPAQPRQPPQQAPPPPSIFSSNKAVPALGSVLAPYLDMHLLVSKLPAGKADAGILYSDSTGGVNARTRNLKGVKIATVVEVVGDRWGGRVGAWGVFPEQQGI